MSTQPRATTTSPCNFDIMFRTVAEKNAEECDDDVAGAAEVHCSEPAVGRSVAPRLNAVFNFRISRRKSSIWIKLEQ